MLAVMLAVITLAVAGGGLTWLLTFCLRNGVVGGGMSGQDAHRDAQPIRYWFGIAALALGVAFSTIGFIYLVWILVT